MKIVTFNLRCAWRGDGINSFIHRVGMIYEKINAEKPTVIGFQEVKPIQLDLLKKMLPEYEFTGLFRSEKFAEEGLFVALRKEEAEAIGSETYWLSPTPFLPGSRFPNQSNCPRVCNVVTLLLKESLRRIRLINLHLDHISEEARVTGMKCVLDDLASREKIFSLPTLLFGDFNAFPDSEAVSLCRKNAFPRLTDLTSSIPVSFHAYGQREEKIDYLFATDDLASECTGATAWDENDCGIYLSDHYPLCVGFETKKEN